MGNDVCNDMGSAHTNDVTLCVKMVKSSFCCLLCDDLGQLCHVQYDSC